MSTVPGQVDEETGNKDEEKAEIANDDVSPGGPGSPGSPGSGDNEDEEALKKEYEDINVEGDDDAYIKLLKKWKISRYKDNFKAAGWTDALDWDGINDDDFKNDLKMTKTDIDIFRNNYKIWKKVRVMRKFGGSGMKKINAVQDKFVGVLNSKVFGQEFKSKEERDEFLDDMWPETTHRYLFTDEDEKTKICTGWLVILLQITIYIVLLSSAEDFAPTSPVVPVKAIEFVKQKYGFNYVAGVTLTPSRVPTQRPTFNPTLKPTQKPTFNPTLKPTQRPTLKPTTRNPTPKPTPRPTPAPPTTRSPSKAGETGSPSKRPSRFPTKKPTLRPTYNPNRGPTPRPSYNPTKRPTARPSYNPTNRPTARPSYNPTKRPVPGPTLPLAIRRKARIVTFSSSTGYTYKDQTNALGSCDWAETFSSSSSLPPIQPDFMTCKPEGDYGADYVGGVCATILIMLFVFPDVWNALMSCRGKKFIWLSLVLAIEGILAIAAAFRISFGGQTYEVILNALGVLFLHEMDEKIFEVTDNLSPKSRIVFWIVLVLLAVGLTIAMSYYLASVLYKN